jgi:hypothetical protein
LFIKKGYKDISCGTITLMALVVCKYQKTDQGLQISENWSRSANIRKLVKDHKSYGSTAIKILYFHA